MYSVYHPSIHPSSCCLLCMHFSVTWFADAAHNTGSFTNTITISRSNGYSLTFKIIVLNLFPANICNGRSIKTPNLCLWGPLFFKKKTFYFALKAVYFGTGNLSNTTRTSSLLSNGKPWKDWQIEFHINFPTSAWKWWLGCHQLPLSEPGLSVQWPVRF